MIDTYDSIEHTLNKLGERLRSTLRAFYVLHANGNDEMAQIVLSRIETINLRIVEMNALLDQFEREDADRFATIVAAAPIVLGTEESPAYLAPAGAYAITAPPVWQGPVSTQSLDQPAIDAAATNQQLRRASIATLAVIAIVLGGLFGSVFFTGQFKSPTQMIEQRYHQQLDEVIVTTERVEVPVIVETAEPVEVTHVVARGDSLWKLAEQYYGDGRLWGKIWTENAEQISNPSLIFPGQTLIISTLETGVELIGDIT